MSSKKINPASGVAASESAGNTMSQEQFSTAGKEPSRAICVADFLGHGIEERKLSSEVIGNIEAVHGVRLSRQQLQVLIRKERMNGELILSLSGRTPGYFLPSLDGPEGQSEAMACMNMLWHMARETAATLSAMRETYSREYHEEGF